MENINWVREDIKAVQKAADRGRADAQYELGKRYLAGRDVPRNQVTGFGWCQRAADRGVVKALNTVGYCHAMGLGTTKSARRAFDAFLKAMLLGDMVATYNLAFCYEQGVGIKADQAIAEMLYSKSAKMGYPKAQGVCACIRYNKKDCTIFERERALRWFERAAERGDEVAAPTFAVAAVASTPCPTPAGRTPIPKRGRASTARRSLRWRREGWF